MKCNRCGRSPRKNYRVLALPMILTVNYQTHERRVYPIGTVLCAKTCLRSLWADGTTCDGEKPRYSVGDWRSASDQPIFEEQTR